MRKDRLLYPQKRMGARGEGKWKRISWDEAITEVATHLYETMLEKGPAGNYVHIGAGVLTEARAASIKRLGSLLGAVRPYIASYVGDMFPGVSAVYGEGNIGCTYDFVFTTNVAVFWGCNPNTSRIPDAHYLWEGKYNGSKIIVITPEFSSTAIHADLWVPVKAGLRRPPGALHHAAHRREASSTSPSSSRSTPTSRCWCARTRKSWCGCRDVDLKTPERRRASWSSASVQARQAPRVLPRL